MTIAVETIRDAVARYDRERDRYLKLAGRVSDLCRVNFIEENAVRAQITFRTKTVKSFQGKLERFARRPDKSLGNIEAVFADIGDFAGVRIATYQPEDVPKVADMVCNFFDGPGGGAVKPDPKDKLIHGNFYRATHCDVYLREEDLVGNYENLRGTSCEIQICSMMAHVWNEIEHDIGYKPSGSGAGDVELGMLESLGHLTRSGDAVITRLLAATELRLEANKGEFVDVHDLVAQLRSSFPSADLAVNAGQAYDEARLLGLISTTAIKQRLGAGALDASVAEERIEAFNEFLVRDGSVAYTLNKHSADVLIIAMLHALASDIEANHPVSRGKGRPPRVFHLARLYQRFVAEGNAEGGVRQ